MEETFNKLMTILAEAHAAMRANQSILKMIDKLKDVALEWEEGLKTASLDKICLLCGSKVLRQHATLRAADIVPPGEDMRLGVKEVSICVACWKQKKLGDRL